MSSSPRPALDPGRSLDAVRVQHLPSQHLEAAAEPQHPPAPAQMGADVDVPPLGQQEGEVGPRVLAARQDGEVDIARQGLARLHETHSDLAGERVEIVEIGDTRIAVCTATRGVPVSIRSASSAIESSAGSLRASSNQGSTPRQGSPESRSSAGIAGSNRAGSPRNLLTI